MTRRASFWLPILAAAGLLLVFARLTLSRLLQRGESAYLQVGDLVVQYLIYCAIVLIAYGALSYRAAKQRELHTSQLETLLAQTRLQMLGMQLQPHFLFNTLNTIAELVHQQPATAERMIAGLSHLLRETLHAGLVDRVPVEQELQLLDRYVEIQRARFGDRLTLNVVVDDTAKQALVPSLLLQPLVENAIKHGIGARAGPGRIEILIARADSMVTIEIRDDGLGLRATPVKEGIGLGNCRSRLQTLYGPGNYRLDIGNRTGGGAAVTIALPFQTTQVTA